MQGILERYMKCCGLSESPDNNVDRAGGTDRVAQFTEKFKSLQSTFIGDDLERLSSRDLIRLEQQIHDTLGRIRAKKEELFLVQLQEINAKIAATGSTGNANSNVLEKMVEFMSFGSQNTCAEGHNGYAGAGAPQMDASQSAQRDSDTGAQSNPTAEGLPAAKRSRMTGDLNKSPCNSDQEWSREY